MSNCFHLTGTDRVLIMNVILNTDKSMKREQINLFKTLNAMQM